MIIYIAGAIDIRTEILREWRSPRGGPNASRLLLPCRLHTFKARYA